MEGKYLNKNLYRTMYSDDCSFDVKYCSSILHFFYCKTWGDGRVDRSEHIYIYMYMALRENVKVRCRSTVDNFYCIKY